MSEPPAVAARPIPMNRKQWAPVAAVSAVVAMLVGVSLVSKAGVTADPPLLRLASAETSTTVAAADARGAYRLSGTLPDVPVKARVRELSATPAIAAQVRLLAKALGEAEAPIRVEGAWRAGSLVVTDEPGNPWTWGASCAPDSPPPSYGTGAKDLTTSSCAFATVSSSGATSIASAAPGTVSSVVPPSGTNAPSTGNASTGNASTGSTSTGSTSTGSASIGSGSTTSPSTGSPSTGGGGACLSQPSVGPAVVCGGLRVAPPVLPPEKVLITEAQALAATARVRNALGLDGAPTRVEGLRVVVDPLAGGRHTTGLASLFQLSSWATVVRASGSLSTGRDGALYPLRTARKAFDDVPAVAPGAPCGAAGCPPGAAVTGAQLGLSRVALSGGAAALVPAWLFAVQGSPVPLAVVAVLDRFMTGPGPAPTKPGTQPPDDPAPEPGNPAPDPGGLPLPPPTEKPAVPTDRESFGFDGAYADAGPTVVVIRYGDSGTCPSQTVRHDVVQDSARVVVTLTRTRMPNDQACTDDYRAMPVRITLAAPLGGREVIDGSRKQPVPISTGTPPFG